LAEPVGYAAVSILDLQDKISRIQYGSVNWNTTRHDWVFRANHTIPCVGQDTYTSFDIGVYVNAANFGNPRLNKRIYQKKKKDFAVFSLGHMGPPV
jgi:hypothetical protein